MQIYVVKQGDSVYSIAQKFGVTMEQIISNNQLTTPESLTVGQTLVILFEQQEHTVTRGESMYSIAKKYGLALSDLLQANPSIASPYTIYPEQVIIIPPLPKIGAMEVNGFAFPFISPEVLANTLPNLTYFSPFSYEVLPSGMLTNLSDEQIVQQAIAAGVEPLMVITNMDPDGGFSGEITTSLFTNQQAKQTLFEQIILTMQQKSYRGLVVDFEYINPADRDAYTAFLHEFKSVLSQNKYSLFVAVAPKTSATQTGTLYEAHDYESIGQIADRVIIMTYEWGYTYGEPQAVAPLNEVQKVLNYAVSAIPAHKILMGIPNYGYDWTLPYVEGSAASVIGNTRAVELAKQKGAFIQFDNLAQSPYFNYYQDGRRHIVWFEDARSIQAKLLLAHQLGLGGVSYWTVIRYFQQAFLVQGALFDVQPAF